MSDLLETFLVDMYSSLQRFWPPLVFFIAINFFAILCKSVNTGLNVNEINLYSLYSVT